MRDATLLGPWIRRFLQEHLVEERNQRFAAIHALARFVGEHDLEHIDWCAQIRCIPYKKCTKSTVSYLDKSEIDALLNTPNQSTTQGRHDYALLLFLHQTFDGNSPAAIRCRYQHRKGMARPCFYQYDQHLRRN